MKKVLIILASIAAVLGIAAYVVVFFNVGGNYPVSSANVSMTSTPTSSSSITIASGTAFPSSSAIVFPGSASSSYASTYTTPPVTWHEGNETMSITGASLSGNQLTLNLAIEMGAQMECVPMNMRLLVDERGDLASPVTTQFSFPETGTCQGAPGATYAGQEVIFSVDPTAAPFFFTTGGNANVFFQVATTTTGGLDVSIPSTQG